MMTENATPCNSEKCCQIRNWINAFLKSSTAVFVGEYSYACPDGSRKLKSVICILNKLPEQGLYWIDKPIEDVEPSDVILLCKEMAGA